MHIFSIISRVFKVLYILSVFVQFVLPVKGLFEDISKIIFFSSRMAHSISIPFILCLYVYVFWPLKEKLCSFFMFSLTI